MTRQPKPIAGVDTPRADDIITPCTGNHCKCGGWTVTGHPKYTSGGGAFVEGKGLMEWVATPEWIEAEAKVYELGISCRVGCGKPQMSDAQRAEWRAARKHADSLRHFTGEKAI